MLYDNFYRETLKVTSYCSFDFHNFPFDHHECDLIFGSLTFATWRIKLETPYVMSKIVEKGKYKIKVDTDSKLVPFDINATSMPSFDVTADGYNYSYTGITLHFKRNDLGLLGGSFYGPLTTFAILSMFSYFIDIEMVGLLIQLALIFSNCLDILFFFFFKGPRTYGNACSIGPNIHKCVQFNRVSILGNKMLPG